MVAPVEIDGLSPSELKATEGAPWGAAADHGFLRHAVIVSDDAGQFAVGQHALCWVYAERLVHRLDTCTDLHRAVQQHMRGLICWLYADLKACRPDPSPHRRGEMRARFDRIFARRTAKPVPWAANLTLHARGFAPAT